MVEEPSKARFRPAEMPTSFSHLHDILNLLSEPIRESLSKTSYKPSESSDVSIKSLLLPPRNIYNESDFQSELTNFSLLCAALASSQTSTYDQLSWIPVSLSNSAFRELYKAFSDDQEKDLAMELMPKLLPSVSRKVGLMLC